MSTPIGAWLDPYRPETHPCCDLETLSGNDGAWVGFACWEIGEEVADRGEREVLEWVGRGPTVKAF